MSETAHVDIYAVVSVGNTQSEPGVLVHLDVPIDDLPAGARMVATALHRAAWLYEDQADAQAGSDIRDEKGKA